MTTYATSTTQPAPPNGGPPAPPSHYAGGPPTQRTPRPRRSGIITAASAFVIAAAAAAATAPVLASPLTPAQHTINVVPPPPAEHSAAEIQAAKEVACTAWDQTARTIASAAKTRASLGETTGGSSFDTEEARAVEKRTTAAQIAFLRTQISPATPPEVQRLIRDWTATQINSMHGANVRDWKQSNEATNKGNDLVDVIVPACGLR